MKITIQKFDPSVDAAPYDIVGEVEYKKDITALEAVTAIHENQEPVSFDFSCHARCCGRCAVLIDGVPGLMCMTPHEDGDHAIRLLNGFPVVRDLVVDKTPLYDKITAVSDRIWREPVTKQTMAASYNPDAPVDMVTFLQACTRCGMCNSVCPAMQEHPGEYSGPAVMVALAIRHFDHHDEADRVLEAVSNGMYHCIQCGKCSEVCMSMIDHLKLWEILRSEAEERGLKPSYA